MPRRGSGRLRGARVVVTRAEGADGPLSRHLSERGAEVLNWPVVGFEPPEDPSALDRALGRLEKYDWIVFTSPRAVTAVEERTASPTGRPRTAAVGKATAARLRESGWPVDIEARPSSGEGLVASFSEIGCAGARILFPASSIARPTVPRGLRELGAAVDRVTAYRIVPAPLDRQRCLAVLDDADPPILTFTSPSAVSALETALGGEGLARLLASCPTVVIGETTAEALRASGFSPTRTAVRSTLEGLADAIGEIAREVRVG